METLSRALHRVTIVPIFCACALLLYSCEPGARALGSSANSARASSTNACERYVNAAASELISGVAKRGYQGAVIDQGVEGTWYQNEVAELTQQLDFKYGLGSTESDAWNKDLHAYLSRAALRTLTNGEKVKDSHAASKSIIRRWCARG
jgi:hypothetical protein